MNLTIGNLDDLGRDGCIFEPKLDGIRALCFVNKEVRFISRYGRDITHDYPKLDVRKQIGAKQCVLDGEIVTFDKKGRSSFQLLQEGHSAMFIAEIKYVEITKDGRLRSLVFLRLRPDKKSVAGNDQRSSA
jgi:ATP-dependent DNA ligase